MTGRKNDPNYKVISGYVPKDLAQRVRQVAKERGITLHKFLEEASIMWLRGGINPEPGTIFELVAHNLSQLKKSGIEPTHLNAIARGEVLPTLTDFHKITSILKLSDQEKQQLWDSTYKLKSEINNDHNSI